MRRVTDVTPFTAFHFTFDDESLMIGFRIFFPAPKKYPILTAFSREPLDEKVRSILFGPLSSQS